MKISINKSAKRVLSITLALVMLVGTLFTANVGVTIIAGAETADNGSIIYLKDASKSASTGITLNSFTKVGNDYIIDSVEKLSWVCTTAGVHNTINKSFKVADGIKAFVLQTEEYLNNTKVDITKIDNYTAVKELFEKNVSGRYNWITGGTETFDGKFDGNGVAIYGLFGDGTTVSSEKEVALFPNIDGGGTTVGECPSTKPESEWKVSNASPENYTTIKNLAVKNSYFKGSRRMGVLYGTAQWYKGGACVYGAINIQNCVIGNCYLEGQNIYGPDNTLRAVKENKDNSTHGEMGIICGSSAHDPALIDSCIVYGCYSVYKRYLGEVSNNKLINITGYVENTYADGTKISGGKYPFSLACSNTYCTTSHTAEDKKITIDVRGTIRNSIILDTRISGFERDTADRQYFFNVYTNVRPTYETATDGKKSDVTVLKDDNTAKGEVGRFWMPELNWAKEADANGAWYVVDGDYPTPFTPHGWTYKDPMNYKYEGKGTKENPYIIRSVDQLWEMVNEQSYSGTEYDVWETYDESGNAVTLVDDPDLKNYLSKYYKVADGVEALYINDVETREEVEALVASNSYNWWNPTAENSPIGAFSGNFDGNGVTIYGLITTKGFVNKIDGKDAAIKNVHFKAAYVTGAQTAVITSNYGYFGKAMYKEGGKDTSKPSNNQDWKNKSSVYTVANVSVTESCIKSTETSTEKASAGGLLTLSVTPPLLVVRDCMFDGVSSVLTDGTKTTSGADENSPKAGIISLPANTGVNNISIYDCVSINEHPITMVTGKEYGRYKSGTIDFDNVYGVLNTDITSNADYVKLKTFYDLPVKTQYQQNDAPTLDWYNETWILADVAGDRVIPMSILKNLDAKPIYSEQIANISNGIGASSFSGVKGFNGKYGNEYKLTGNGTADNPYLITNALELANAISSGGKHLDQKLYYKLICDINLDGQWINMNTIEGKYVYVPFAGVLDGANFVVSGIYASDLNSAGFIPVLDGGTVKNLHIRGAQVYSDKNAGVMVGTVTENGGQIIGCSVEGSEADATNSHAIAVGNATIKDSYYIVDGTQKYFDENGNEAVPNANDIYPNGTKWYKGAKNAVSDGLPRFLVTAKAHKVTDVDGDGIYNDQYELTDLVSLRKKLLRVSDYNGVYSDVNGDGKTDLRDLVAVRREMVGDYAITDGFWRNLANGTVSIYYDENDTYDMARKLQLYLQANVEGLIIEKIAGPDVTDSTAQKFANQEAYNEAIAQNAIVFVKETPTTQTYMNYDVDYNAANNVLTFTGHSFTAVEQAVLDFINSDYFKNKTNLPDGQVLAGSILTQKALETSKTTDTTTTEHSYKEAVTVGGTTYYYAWGDEFDGNGSYDTDTWEIRNYKYEDEDITEAEALALEDCDDTFLNVESPTIDAIDDLWEVKNGKLTIWRGVNLDTYTGSADYEWGYKGVNTGEAGTTNDFGRPIDADDIYVDPGLVQSKKSMLFKQGYAEMRASLPSDGHAFPAWWFYNGTSDQYNSYYDSSLYGKVYKENDLWDEKTNKFVPSSDKTNLSTYKYQIPMAFLEFDIVEFMERTNPYTESRSKRTGSKTGKRLTYPQLTIHKNYEAHTNTIDGQTSVHIPDWDLGSIVYSKTAQEFNSTSGKGSLNHHYQHSQFSYHNSGDGKSLASGAFNIPDGITNTWTYGFSWWVNEANQTYELKVYVDFNQSGVMGDETSGQRKECVITVTQDDGHPSTNTNPYTGKTETLNDFVRTYKNNKKAESAVWNQYAYMLIDNAFESTNGFGTATKSWGTWRDETGCTPYTDVLSQESGDKATFDIEYVRVYQQDGKRDIVTQETEPFNTGNHFGY